jgi:virginiamycin B lyase
MSRRLARVALLLALAVTALSACALPASGAPLGEVRVLPTPGVAFPRTLAAGPEGDMWISGGAVVARMTTGGEFTTLNTSETPLDALVAGSDGNIWFGENGVNSTVVGRLTPAGEVTQFNIEGTFAPHWLTLGPDGDVWYTAGLPGIKIVTKEGESSAIGRITPSGQVTEFDLKSRALLQHIVTGPDGNLWFVNQAEPNFTIDRITPTGEIKEFAIAAHPWLKPSGIAAGVNGNVYFGASGENPITTEEESVIGEITPAGETKLVEHLHYSEVFDLATGPEGSLWFTGLHTEPLRPNVIGRLTPAGVLEEDVASLDAETAAEQITPGSDGSMWFTTYDKETEVNQVNAIGTGAPAASQTPPTVTGADQVGSVLSCAGATWATWAGQQPSVSLYGFDGYTWLLDGHVIAGQNTQTLSVPAADVGHQISCSVKATYQLLNITVSAVSAGVTIGAAPVVTTVSPPAPAGSALTLLHQTDTVSSHGALHVTLDCSGAPCTGTIKLLFKTRATTGKGKHRRTKTVVLTIAVGTFTALAPGADKVKLKLTSHGLSLLEAHRYKLGATANISFISSGTSHASTVGAIGLRGTRPKSKSG